MMTAMEGGGEGTTAQKEEREEGEVHLSFLVVPPSLGGGAFSPVSLRVVLISPPRPCWVVSFPCFSPDP